MRVWFNHWFSTVYHLIDLVRKGDPGKFTIIGSSANPYTVYKQVCDEFYQEPDGLTPEAYVEFCLEFCREHQVDIFAPRRNMVEIVRNEARFQELGVKLFANCSADTMAILDDKLLTYDFFQEKFPEIIPAVRIVHSMEEFEQAYLELKEISTRVCYKLTVDEGARSFRVIDDSIEEAKALLENPGMKITMAAARTILGQYDFSIPLMMMPYLSGVEISVDCLQTPQGKITVPRYKMNSRFYEIIFKEELMELCSRMMDELKLNMPLNIQFKKEGDRLYLLEVNPRMSGGLPMTCVATGINIPSIAINSLLGVEKEWAYPDFRARKAAHLETPLCLN